MLNSSESIHPHLHRRFSGLITQRTGIVFLPDGASERIRLQSRLSRLLKRLGLVTFEQLWNTLETSKPNSPEWIEFIHAVSTHRTGFFREPAHFARLAEHAGGFWMNRQDTFQMWSAACSTGEEPVSAAITLSQTAAFHNGGAFQILATDLDSVVIEQAKTGIYPKPDLPRDILEIHFLEGRGKRASLVRVKDQLLSSIRYEPFNLLHASYPAASYFDAVFCRNVLIYFDESTRDRIVTKMAESLAPGGLLFLGHSESYSHREDLECVAPTVYRNRRRAPKLARQGSTR